jgi:NADPH:quinone reductase-like Zn-dependent oxidoreductase
VSLFALQLPRLAGARVIATTASAARGEKLRALGASAVVNYRTTPDWQDEVLKHTGGRGVDRVVEVGGGGTLERSIRCVRIEGVIALVGLLATPSHIDPTPIMARALTLKGISVGSRVDLETVLRRFAEAKLSPVIDRRFTFEAAADALACLGGDNRFGKLVITYPES